MKSWTVSDAFWAKVEPFVPAFTRPTGRIYHRKPGAGHPPHASAAGVLCHRLCSAHGLPMEGAAVRIRLGQRGS